MISLFVFTSAVPRTRKANLDDAKAKAADASKKRDEANANPKRKDIPIEIASLTNKMEEIKVKIEGDKTIQNELFQLQEQQIQIDQIKKSADQELEKLQEDIKLDSNSLQFRAYKIKPPTTDLPTRDVDKAGEQVKKLMNSLHDEIQERLEERDSELGKTNDDVRRLTAVVSEKNALLHQDKQSIGSIKVRMDQLQSNLDKTEQVVQELRVFEGSGFNFDATAKDPQKLLDHLTDTVEKMDSESTEGIPQTAIRKVMNKLLKQVRRLCSKFLFPFVVLLSEFFYDPFSLPVYFRHESARTSLNVLVVRKAWWERMI
jgi:DNA repair protein RAD50